MTNWTLDQLEAFTSAVKQGSFSAAARHLGKAQSRISNAIANLEIDLGFELFDRTARLPVLTTQGEDLFIEASAVLEQCQRLNSKAKSVAGKQESRLTIALDEAVPISSFELFFEKLGRQYPLLKVTIFNGSQQDISDWVEQEKADLGILFQQATLSQTLEFSSLSQFKYSLIVSPKHPLACTKAPTVELLNRYRQLVICPRNGSRQSTPISSNHWFVDSYYYSSALVIRNIGWALVPEHIAQSEWHKGQVVELSTEFITQSLLIEMGIVKRRDQGKGPVMQWIYQYLKEAF